jgi:hypothetical protein
MTDKEKAMAAGAAILAIAALFLLLRSGGNNDKIVRQNSGAMQQPGNVTLQQVTINREPLTIPRLEIPGGWENLSAIGACCADCSGSRPRQSFEPAASRGPTIIFNEGARGPNVYNYYNPAPQPYTFRRQIIGRAG